MELLTYNWQFQLFYLGVGASLLTVLALLLTVRAFLLTVGKVCLIRALRDCKQRSLTVSKKTPTVSKKTSQKRTLGLQIRARFEKGIFRVFSGTRANLTRSGRAGVSRLLPELGSLAKMALRLWCGGFSRLFRFIFRARFRKLQVVIFTPLFLFWCFSLLCAFLLAFNPSYFLVFLQKHCCPPEKGLFLFISQCLPFFLLGLFHFSFSLSLSLFISCFVFFFL